MSAPVASSARMRALWQRQHATVIASALMLGSAWALKHGYSRAGATELHWVLGPSCWLANALGDVGLTFEPGAGFISHAARMVVGVPCAGVNFLIVSWLALFFACQGGFVRLRSKLAWWAGALCAAYVATIVANGTRIVLAAQLAHAAFPSGFFDAEQVHRLLGVVVYSAMLLAVCGLGVRLVARSRTASSQRGVLLPLGCYLGVAILVPLLRRASELPPQQFAEHALHTCFGSAAVAGLAWLSGVCLDRLCSRRFLHEDRSTISCTSPES